MEKKRDGKPEFLISGKFCPQCEEALTPADLEMFPRCPYCNHLFQDGPDLEQFVLKPVLSRWISSSFSWFVR